MDEQEYKKRKMLEALSGLAENREPRTFGSVVPDLKSQNLAKGALDKDVFLAKGASEVVPEPVTRLKGSTQIIDTKVPQPLISGKDFAQKQKDLDINRRLRSSFKAAAEAGDEGMMDQLRKVAQKIGKGAKTGLKMLPIVGAVGSALMSGEASAGVPLLGDAESVGMSPEGENQMMAEIQGRKDYEQSQAARDRAARLEALAKLSKSNE